MTDLSFDYFRELLKARSGLTLTPEKGYLIRGRLNPLATSLGLQDADALLSRLRSAPTESLIQSCVDAMATHETSFFRDRTPFDGLEQAVLPRLVAARRGSRRLRIWCAACSSGQEPYSLAMLARETPALQGWTVEIVATDMAAAILSKASKARYTDFEVRRGLSDERRSRWMTPVDGGWEVKEDLRRLVSFRTHNLLKGAPPGEPFDIVFCRNVLIYFDVEGKRRVLGQLARSLQPDGALFLGSAETLIGVTDEFISSPGVRGLYLPVVPARLSA